MLKVRAILQDGAVVLEFMTDDALEAEEVRAQWLACDCVAEVRIFDLPGGLRCKRALFQISKLKTQFELHTFPAART